MATHVLLVMAVCPFNVKKFIGEKVLRRIVGIHAVHHAVAEDVDEPRVLHPREDVELLDELRVPALAPRDALDRHVAKVGEGRRVDRPEAPGAR